MPFTVAAPGGFGNVVQRFSEQAGLLRVTALRDRHFRSLCDDLVLALDTLAEFESREDAAQRPEVPEYRTLIAELESEVADYLADLSAPGDARNAGK